MSNERSEQSMKAQSIALAVVALMAGILIGVVGAHSFNITDEAVTSVVRQQSATDTPAANLRASLNTRMVEHVYVTEAAMMAAYRNNPSAEQRFMALERNADQLAAELSVLENTSREELRRLGQQQADALQGYVTAARRQDPQAMRQHKQQLDTFTIELAGIVAKDLDMSQSELEQSLQTHVGYMERILNAHAADNYAEAQQQQQQARTHMYRLSNQLATDIVSAYPGKFE